MMICQCKCNETGREKTVFFLGFFFFWDFMTQSNAENHLAFNGRPETHTILLTKCPRIRAGSCTSYSKYGVLFGGGGAMTPAVT